MRPGKMNIAISTVTALLLLAATGVAQNTQLSTSSLGTSYSVMSASNVQLRVTVSEAVVGITRGSTFVVGSGFLVDSLVGRIITRVVDPGTIPKTFMLVQNFPNPFNPSTTIRYGLPRSTIVSLKVYDLLGREVATLMQGYLKAGYYQVQWDADVASGIYFYRLQTEGFVETKKMILLK